VIERIMKPVIREEEEADPAANYIPNPTLGRHYALVIAKALDEDPEKSLCIDHTALTEGRLARIYENLESSDDESTADFEIDEEKLEGSKHPRGLKRLLKAEKLLMNEFDITDFDLVSAQEQRVTAATKRKAAETAASSSGRKKTATDDTDQFMSDPSKWTVKVMREYLTIRGVLGRITECTAFIVLNELKVYRL